MRRLILLAVLLGGCAPMRAEHVRGGGVSADGETAWFGVVESEGRHRAVRIYRCTATACVTIPTTGVAAPVVAPPEAPRREPSDEPDEEVPRERLDGMDGIL